MLLMDLLYFEIILRYEKSCAKMYGTPIRILRPRQFNKIVPFTHSFIYNSILFESAWQSSLLPLPNYRILLYLLHALPVYQIQNPTEVSPRLRREILIYYFSPFKQSSFFAQSHYKFYLSF